MSEPTGATTITWPKPDRDVLKRAAYLLDTSFGRFVRHAAARELERIAELKDDAELKQLVEEHRLARRYS